MVALSTRIPAPDIDVAMLCLPPGRTVQERMGASYVSAVCMAGKSPEVGVAMRTRRSAVVAIIEGCKEREASEAPEPPEEGVERWAKEMWRMLEGEGICRGVGRVGAGRDHPEDWDGVCFS